MRSVWLPSGHIPLREPPCPDRQVGEGVCPALDAQQLYDGEQRRSRSRHRPRPLTATSGRRVVRSIFDDLSKRAGSGSRLGHRLEDLQGRLFAAE